MVVPSRSQIRLLFELAAPVRKSILWRWDRPAPFYSFSPLVVRSKRMNDFFEKR
jgi:hypothetical protein